MTVVLGWLVLTAFTAGLLCGVLAGLVKGRWERIQREAAIYLLGVRERDQ